MPELDERYAAMWASAHAAFVEHRFQVDPLIDSATDTRRGLTLRVPLSGVVLERAAAFQERLRAIQPDLYFAAAGEAHLTVLSIVSCRDGFSLDAAAEVEYGQTIAAACRGMSPFKIEFKGLTASPESVMLRGHPVGDQLATARAQFRAAFAESPLFSTIDARYRLITAHSTLARFRASITHAPRLMECLDEFHDHDFGTLAVDHLELVHNDWWHRRGTTRLVQKIPLS